MTGSSVDINPPQRVCDNGHNGMECHLCQNYTQKLLSKPATPQAIVLRVSMQRVLRGISDLPHIHLYVHVLFGLNRFLIYIYIKLNRQPF